jgi:site-specific recombinase XerD
MRQEIEPFVRHLQNLRAPRTVAAYGAIVAAFADFAKSDFSTVPHRTDVEAFLARPRADGARRAASTRNQELAALRVFSAFAMRELGWQADPTEGIPFVREPSRDPAFLTTAELRALFRATASMGGTWRTARNLAIVALLSQVGLRVHELVALDVSQVDLAAATLVAVRGKGGTVHDLPLNPETVALLAAWLAVRAAITAGADGQDAVFIATTGKRLSVRAVQYLMGRLRERMGTKKKLSPHALRHTAGTLAIGLGSDLDAVGELLRHSDINTTRRYTHLAADRARAAVVRLGTTIPRDVLPEPSEKSQESGPRPMGEENDCVQHDFGAAFSVEGRARSRSHRRGIPCNTRCTSTPPSAACSSSWASCSGLRAAVRKASRHRPDQQA